MWSGLKRWFGLFWSSYRIKLGLTVMCVLVAAFDTFVRPLSTIAASALALALAPWIVGIIEKLSVPGGFEFVFAKAEQRLDHAPTVPTQEEKDAFTFLSGTDPNAAIAYLRIQIERRLREIAEQKMLEPSARGPRTLRELTNELWKVGAISKDAVALIHDLMPVMNEAAHGVHLNESAANFALEYGPKILSMLRTPE